MNDASSFSRVSRSSQALYGPRKLLICGLTPEGQTAFDDVITTAAIQELPLVYARSSDLEIPMADILAYMENTGRDELSRMPAAIIMSGITENELHQLISSYRKVGMPEPLWATLTPTSENWTLRQLLTELSAERQAMKEGQASKQ
jgi:Domain of unknown function (DUF3783)